MALNILLSLRNFLYSPVIETPETKSIRNTIHALGERSTTFFCKIEGCVNVHLSRQLTLADFRATGNIPLCTQLGKPNLQEKLIQRLELKRSLEIISQYYPFLERINQISSEY